MAHRPAWLRVRFGGGGGAREETGLKILAFEVAAAMSRLVSLYCSLSDVEDRRLRVDALLAEGVARVTSTDQSLLLWLACGEVVADLDCAAGSATRFGTRCCAARRSCTIFDRV
ncbi:Os10g0380300 [Oryza sativa Japonica Group]|uniref:Os10g0380300 protein n=2 Tax=Oryza sativa subsp. japonica TaxID=39947 RepID=Q338X5_ORYSJ|nr:hypothetical protein LOC_Os10g23840 [Oryza sativa Japonica Group]EAZ15903.1 hypothetical protein OsJ_31321 [Oryza sativa Japonica Group]BAT10623.1 Os10g0380300 [Oryza sativa Japonica Group]